MRTWHHATSDGVHIGDLGLLAIMMFTMIYYITTIRQVILTKLIDVMKVHNVTLV